MNYHKLTGKEYRIIGLKGPSQAHKLINGSCI